MIRGLVHSWKQLVFYDFDRNMTKDLLFAIIRKVESIGFPVVAVVNDLGPSNVRLWKNLDINTDNTSFPNPSDASREIHVFADAPHLIKLIRNNFLDSGFRLGDGSYVRSGCVNELIQRSVSDLNTTFRLTANHVSVTGVKRMRVNWPSNCYQKLQQNL